MNSGRPQPCDEASRKWCLRVSTLGIMLSVLLAMLFYSWGGVLFDDEPYVVAYVNTCQNTTLNAKQYNRTHWYIPVPARAILLPAPPDATYAWDGVWFSTEQCMSVLCMGY